MCLQLFRHFSQPAPVKSLLFPRQVPTHPPTHVSPLRGQQTLSYLAQGDPCHQRWWQNKKIASVSTQLGPPPTPPLPLSPYPMPHHPSVSILFLWLMLKGHTVSQDFHKPHPAPPTLSPSNLNPVHPRLKVYLRLWLSDNEGLNVNIQSTSSLNTPHAERRKKKEKKESQAGKKKKKKQAQRRAEQRRTR